MQMLREMAPTQRQATFRAARPIVKPDARESFEALASLLDLRANLMKALSAMSERLRQEDG